MRRKVWSVLLVAVMLLTIIPMNVFAASDFATADDVVLYGDVNADGKLDDNDVNMLKLYIAEEEPDGFVLNNADVNRNGVVDLKDLLMIKKHLAGWDISLGVEPETITFEENGGSEVEDIKEAVGEPIGTLPTPIKTGYIFDGWYTDNETFEKSFTDETMPAGGATVYAKWVEKTFTITFDVNGGNALDADSQTKTVYYDGTYGKLPEPAKDSANFKGWFTAAKGGTQVTSSTKVTIDTNQTLYAQWNNLKNIPSTIFEFGINGGIYKPGVEVRPTYAYRSEAGASYEQDEFTFKYKKQGTTEYETGLPVDAGIYDVTVSRPEDDKYNYFEHTYETVVAIDKAVRTLDTVEVVKVEESFNSLKLQVVTGAIVGLSDEATIIYSAVKVGDDSSSVITSAAVDGIIYGLEFDTEYSVTVTVLNDPNYYDATSTTGYVISTSGTPTESWMEEGNYDISWYNETTTDFKISSAAQLAGLAYLVNNGIESFDEYKSVAITKDINLAGYEWVPIGTKEHPFNGTFSGKNYNLGVINTISGICTNDAGNEYVGLFGYMEGTQNSIGYAVASIQNVIVAESYIQGCRYVGGIVGGMGLSSSVTNCTSYADVTASGEGDKSEAGGIAGIMVRNTQTGTFSNIENCTNFGNVEGKKNCVGGIVGNAASGYVMNCANFGKVKGVSVVGGIIGLNTDDSLECENAYIYNCVNYGKINGSEQYIGAVVGRNCKDNGYVANCYYLEGSAECNGESRKALGTKTGSLEDITTNEEREYKNASFTSMTSELSGDCGYGSTDVVTALNAWVTERESIVYSHTWSKPWILEGPDGYAIQTGLPTK